MKLKPKDWVLVRDDEKEKWKLDIFSHFVDGASYPYICVGSYYDECIPYEGNEKLLGTTGKAAEKNVKEIGGWKVGDKVEVEYDADKKWYDGEIVRFDPSHTNWFGDEKMPYYIRSECFKYNDGCAWCAARQLREPEEKNADEDWNVGDIVEVKNERDGCWYPGKILLIKKGTMPYFVQSEFGFKEVSKLTRCSWCSRDQLRKPEEKPEEEFKVGDKVEVQYCWDDKWYTGTIVKIDPDHTGFDGEEFPYKVAASCFHDSFKSSRWCSRGQLREPVEKPEEEEFKVGDRVEANIDGEWREAIFLNNDGSYVPYHVATTDGKTWWCEAKDVRRA